MTSKQAVGKALRDDCDVDPTANRLWTESCSEVRPRANDEAGRELRKQAGRKQRGKPRASAENE